MAGHEWAVWPGEPSQPSAPAIEVPREAPEHVIGKVIGFRGWSLSGYRLLSANHKQHGMHWQIGQNTAECRIKERVAYLQAGGDRGALFRHAWALAHEHEAPHPDCECGLYAFFDPKPYGLSGLTCRAPVWGAIAAWGRIEVHEDGFRAQHAEPVLLGYSPRDPYEYVVRLQAIKGEFGLPLVTLDELQERALEFGQPVSTSLRPDLSPVTPVTLRELLPLSTVYRPSGSAFRAPLGGLPPLSAPHAPFAPYVAGRYVAGEARAPCVSAGAPITAGPSKRSLLLWLGAWLGVLFGAVGELLPGDFSLAKDAGDLGIGALLVLVVMSRASRP